MRKLMMVCGVATLAFLGCRSHKVAVSNQSDQIATSQADTLRVAFQADSTTEILIFTMTDSGSAAKVAADGSISVKGVKSITKVKKTAQRKKEAAKSAKLETSEIHNRSDTIASQSAQATDIADNIRETKATVKGTAQLIGYIVMVLGALAGGCWLYSKCRR